MLPLIYQGSGGTIGDLLLSSHYMYNQHVLGREVSVVIRKNLRPELKDLYQRHNFLKSIIELDEISGEPYLQYCREKGYESSQYVVDVKHVIGATYHPMSEWMPYPDQPKIDGKDCIAVHVTSSANYNRPAVPALNKYLEIIRNSGKKPVFLGTDKDEKLFESLYPGVKETVPAEHWRFGKDTILQTFSNLKVVAGAIIFSTGTAYAAALQGTPVLELWNTDQWLTYSSYVRQMLGNPIHYLQDCFWDTPLPHLVTEVFPYLKQMSGSFYS